MKKVLELTLGMAIFSLALNSCSQENTSKTVSATTDRGMLTLVANGEDFVRQGFVSKDGWEISFNRVYLNLAEVTAYQVESTFEPNKQNNLDSIKYQAKSSFLNTPETVDLAAGEANAEPILVGQIDTPVGFYNALSWKIAQAEVQSPIAGKTMALQGQASKDGQTINFNLSFTRPLEYICGEYVGEERKGMVKQGEVAQVEMTFHFDHIFGDAETDPMDALNQKALGFQPLAALGTGDRLEADEATLSEKLSAKNYQKLTKAILGLGHVGEGHCAELTK